MVIAAIAIGAGLVYYRRKVSGELLQEAAEVFAYTAELLAAGDSIREAIFGRFGYRMISTWLSIWNETCQRCNSVKLLPSEKENTSTSNSFLNET